MSKTEDNTPLDGELKAYLAGEDGVSAAYRQAGAEEPPAELDRLILAAARRAVQKDAPRATATSRQKFSLAASFMVGVLVASLYFNREDFTGSVVTPAELEEQAILYQPGEPAPAERQEAFQDKAEAESSSADSSALRVIVNNAIPPFRANANRAPQAIAAAVPGIEATEASADVAEERLEEISRDDSEPDLSYRQTREEWLKAILALREEAEQLANTNAQLGEEIELFSETYPDLDLDAELQALQAE